jgi:hypothetical protein
VYVIVVEVPEPTDKKEGATIELELPPYTKAVTLSAFVHPVVPTVSDEEPAM